MPMTSRPLNMLRRTTRWLAILSALASILGPAVIHAQGSAGTWQPLGGPAGRISHLVASRDAANLYAVSVAETRRGDDQTQRWATGKPARSDALYHSRDRGATWQSLTNDLPPGPITALYADPDGSTLYVGLNGELWASPDRGSTWRPVRLGQDGLMIRRIARSADGHYLYVGASVAEPEPAARVYRSDDGGHTWTAFGVPNASGMASLIPHPTDAALLFVTAAGSPLLRSTDAGATWAPVQIAGEAASAVPAQLVVNPDRPDTLLLARALAADRGNALTVEGSDDRGNTWHRLTAAGLPAKATIRTLAALPGNIFLLNTDQGTFRSVDSGDTWQSLDGALSSGGVAQFLSLPGKTASEPSQTVLAATGYGIFVSQDRGALWQAFGTGLPVNSRLAGLLTDPRRPDQVWAISDNRPIAGTPSPPLVLRSLDAGRTWTAAARGLPDVAATAWAADPNTPDNLMIASRDQVLRTNDAGITWQTVRIEPGDHSALAISPSNPRIAYLGGRPVLRSTDGGATWQSMPVVLPGQGMQQAVVTGLAIDPVTPDHLWVAMNGGVAESQDGGRTWHAAGLDGKPVRWLMPNYVEDFRIYAGVAEDGIYRMEITAGTWTPASKGLPVRSTMLNLIPNSKQAGVLWATHDGGGVYRSTDDGDSWSNIGQRLGDNLAQAAALDSATLKVDGKAVEGGLLIGTADAGVWAYRMVVDGSPAPPPQAVDARIEVVWPHDNASVSEAKLANIGLRLFASDSLNQPPCSWTSSVMVWQAIDTNPVEPLGEAHQRSVDGQPFPYWELNDVDVSRARNGDSQIYFMVRSTGLATATSIWAHGADARTYFPQQDVPSGIAMAPIDAVDARIQIVWPHDAEGHEQPPEKATLVNLAVMLFKHGTRLTVPVGWQPESLTLFGAWNDEIGRPLSHEPVLQTRTSGAITYPVWEFTNIPIARAIDPTNRLYLWVQAAGVETYPSIWAHGADARTAFPVPDEPIQGCVP